MPPLFSVMVALITNWMLVGEMVLSSFALAPELHGSFFLKKILKLDF
jgi:hypothetical protein